MAEEKSDNTISSGVSTITMIDNPEGQSEAIIALQNKIQDEKNIGLNVEILPPDQVNVKLETALV